MPDDVAKWLEELGLDKYVDVFVENDVDAADGGIDGEPISCGGERFARRGGSGPAPHREAPSDCAPISLKSRVVRPYRLPNPIESAIAIPENAH